MMNMPPNARIGRGYVSRMKYPDDFINKIICGDCLEVMKEMPDKCVDLVLTDPPYSKEFLSLYENIAKESKRILKNEGLIIAYAGHYHLPKVFELMGKHLKYYWTFCLLHQGGGSKMIFEKRISCFWKPIVAFSNSRKGETTKIISDVIQGSGRNKESHPWEQATNELFPLIEKYTKENDIILDPLLGSGTTAEACKLLHRDFIGIEINPEYCKIAEERLAQGVL